MTNHLPHRVWSTAIGGEVVVGELGQITKDGLGLEWLRLGLRWLSLWGTSGPANRSSQEIQGHEGVDVLPIIYLPPLYRDIVNVVPIE